METNLTDIWDMLKINFYWHLNKSLYIYINTVVCQNLFHTKCQYKHIMDCKNMFQTWFKHVEHCKTLCVPGKFSLRWTQPSLPLTLPSPPISLPPGASGWQRLGVVPIQHWHLVLPLPQFGIATSCSIQRGLWFTKTYKNQLMDMIW